MNISENSRVLILSHGYRETESGGGLPQDIRDFLFDIHKVKDIDYLVYPFPHANFHYAYLSKYRNGELVEKIKTPTIFGPEWFQYIQHIFYTYYLLFRTNPLYDICFALDGLTVLSILILRKIKIFKKLIYYSIDYTPQRFINLTLNYLYHLADRISCRNSDAIWVVAKHMISARRKNKVPIDKCAPFLEVPIGFDAKEINIQLISKIDKFQLIYVGILSDKQGLDIVLGALPKLAKTFPKLKLTIIGVGEYESELKRQVAKYKIKKMVTFLGFIENHRDVEKLLIKASIGIATYKPIPGSFTYYSDPGKIKLYLGCGLPIITTSVPAISKELSRKKAGVVIDYTAESFYNAVENLLGDQKQYEKIRNNAISMSKEFDSEIILKKAFKNTL